MASLTTLLMILAGLAPVAWADPPAPGDFEIPGRGLVELDLHETAELGSGPAADFLRARRLVAAGRHREGAAILEALPPDGLPAATFGSLLGEIRAATGDLDGAIAAWAAVPAGTSLRVAADLARAGALVGAGRSPEAALLLRETVRAPDPEPGMAGALLGLAELLPPEDEEAYRLLRRAWWAYPRDGQAGAVAAALAPWGRSATWQEVGRRAEALMTLGAYEGALAETARRVSEVMGADLDACRFHYVRGRSHYKRGRIDSAIEAFGDIGAACVEVDADYGYKALYLQGLGHRKRGRLTRAAEVFSAIADLYPDASFADDGLTQAGIAYLLLEDEAAARRQWGRALVELPHGDTTPEAAWRLAWSLYLAGRGDEAREVAIVLGGLPLAHDAVHVAAGRYWAARWSLYPDVGAPRRRVEDAGTLDQAVRAWAALCRELPHSFYAQIAWARLAELAPEVAADLQVRPPGGEVASEPRPWVLREEIAMNPAFQEGVALARLGLAREAMAEWSRLDTDPLTGDEMAAMVELRGAAGQRLDAHQWMRVWLRTHPVSEQPPRALRVAYPDLYWAEARVAAEGDRYEARLLHALVREESNFDPTARSPVGARGLAQLMPETAREVAGWLRRPYSPAELTDPAANLVMGGRYLDTLFRQFDGSVWLALASYNGGAGNVGRWLREWRDVPADEAVERIPFLETRKYVKRVIGTWQTMRFEIDRGESPFPDLSAWNHHVRAPEVAP